MSLEFNIQNNFRDELLEDSLSMNQSRQVYNAHYSNVIPRVPSNPSIIHVSDEMLHELGITKNDKYSDFFLNIVTGKEFYPDSRPYAMCYGGHQFGHWAGQLGDGRAINLFEIAHENKSWTFQLKGAGPTPYSRNADGLAVLRSSIREYLCSEAMYHLRVPTTRALSIALSGDQVMRDILYDGHPSLEKGAIVCRVAPSFIRFGNFEIFTSRKDITNLKLLTDYTKDKYYPHIQGQEKEKYLIFFREVTNKTLDLVVEWQRVGFVHGVMNTDNMSILGLTIDYGPYGWMDNFDPKWTPNTTDIEHRRYRFENQSDIALWNLLQLANALYPLIEDIPALEEILNHFHQEYQMRYLEMMAGKLGIENVNDSVINLINELENLLPQIEIDMTIFYRNLSRFKKSDSPDDFFRLLEFSIYKLEELTDDLKSLWKDWIDCYLNILKIENLEEEERANNMNFVNPKFVFRNYMAQLAIDQAEKGDYSLIEEFFQLFKKPYDEQPEFQKWFAKRPEWARSKIGCSMLSCSS